EQWARIWGSEEVDSATGIAIDSAGDVFVTGYTFGPIDGNIQLGANCPGGYCPDAYLTKWDSTGKKKWTKQFGTENGDRASSIVIDEKDNIYISGTAGKNRLCEIESDIFLMKSDTSGNLDEIKIWGTAGEESVNSINISNGKIIISGFTTGGLDNNENKGGKDGFVTVIEK
ncbi:MAG TPA: SBBP repeat-containing protein, partial [bacterium]|nr:SBBP repeat-containing protein [bacterium]